MCVYVYIFTYTHTHIQRELLPHGLGVNDILLVYE